MRPRENDYRLKLIYVFVLSGNESTDDLAALSHSRPPAARTLRADEAWATSTEPSPLAVRAGNYAVTLNVNGKRAGSQTCSVVEDEPVK